ncbi:MAG: ABC transporter substrate-binding protein [Thermomicrobiales bacterium]
MTKYLNLRLLALLLLAIPLIAACGDDDDDGGDPVAVSVALDWFPWAQHSALYLAQDRGFFEDENLDVDFHVPANPEDGLKLVGSGEEDFAISYEADVLLARGEDLPVQSVAALVQHPLNSIMSLESTGIERPADLEGKQIGYAGLPSDEALVKAVLESDGLTLDDVELVNVGFSLAPSLVSGQVDAVIGAYWVYETFQIENETGDTVSVLPLTDWGVPDYYELVLVTSDEMIEEHPETVERFVRAVQQGYEAAAEDPGAAVDALLENNEDAVEEVEVASIELLQPFWTSDGEIDFGTQTSENWERYAGWLKENGLLSDDVDSSEAFTNEFVEEASGD